MSRVSQQDSSKVVAVSLQSRRCWMDCWASGRGEPRQFDIASNDTMG